MRKSIVYACTWLSRNRTHGLASSIRQMKREATKGRAIADIWEQNNNKLITLASGGRTKPVTVFGRISTSAATRIHSQSHGRLCSKNGAPKELAFVECRFRVRRKSQHSRECSFLRGKSRRTKTDSPNAGNMFNNYFIRGNHCSTQAIAVLWPAMRAFMPREWNNETMIAARVIEFSFIPRNTHSSFSFVGAATAVKID